MKARMLKNLRTQQNKILLAALRDRREALGLRQADLAERLGETQTTVSRVENGERRLDVIELRAWLRALRVAFVPFVRKLDRALNERHVPEFRVSKTRAPKRVSRVSRVSR